MSATTSPPRRPMPPVHIRRDFLDAQAHERLLGLALESEARFAQSAVLDGHQPTIRASRTLGATSQPWHERILDRVRALLPELFAALGTKPFTPRFELQLAAHNDGDYYKPHIDTRTGGSERHVRALSAVYYFYREPKAFSGGALRIHRLGTDGSGEGDFLEIEPEENSLVVFPSWAKHEVRPVRCPSGAFEDSRFSVNCWLMAPVRAP